MYLSIGTYPKHLLYISLLIRMRLQAVLTAKSHDRQRYPRHKRKDRIFINVMPRLKFTIQHYNIPRENDIDAFVVTAISLLLAVVSNGKNQFVAQHNEHIHSSPRSDRGQTASFNSNRYH